MSASGKLSEPTPILAPPKPAKAPKTEPMRERRPDNLGGLGALGGGMQEILNAARHLPSTLWANTVVIQTPASAQQTYWRHFGEPSRASAWELMQQVSVR